MLEMLTNFLLNFNFSKVIWDGEELTAFTQNGEPFNKQEFISNSITKIVFEFFQDLLRSNTTIPFSFELLGPPNES